MNDPSKCSKFREDLPLFFSGQLGDEEKLRMQMHLKTCPECRSLFRSEATLMSVASADQNLDLLGDHPECDTLDNYVHSRSSLDSSEIMDIEKHLESCAWCRDMVAKLALLPQELSDLVSSAETPFLDNLADPQVVDVGRIRQARSATGISWRRMGAIAAAAVIILASVLLVTNQFPGGGLQSRVDVEFVDSGETTRLVELRRAAADKPSVTEVNGWISIEIGFDAYPEEESYRVVIEGFDGEVVNEIVLADDFSDPGKLMMRIKTTALSLGEYRLMLHVYNVDPQLPSATLTFPFVLDRD